MPAPLSLNEMYQQHNSREKDFARGCEDLKVTWSLTRDLHKRRLLHVSHLEVTDVCKRQGSASAAPYGNYRKEEKTSGCNSRATEDISCTIEPHKNRYKTINARLDPIHAKSFPILWCT